MRTCLKPLTRLMKSSLLEFRLGMKIGSLERGSLPEHVVYDPIARIATKTTRPITIPGLGKINASKPFRRGKFEYFSPTNAAAYMEMPIQLRDKDVQSLKKAILGDRVEKREHSLFLFWDLMKWLSCRT